MTKRNPPTADFERNLRGVIETLRRDILTTLSLIGPHDRDRMREEMERAINKLTTNLIHEARL